MASSQPLQRIETLLQLEEVRHRFESAWRAGEQPQLTVFLDEADADSRASLFADLLGVELELRRERCEAPAAAEYRRRYPEYAAQVDRVWSEVVPREAPPTGIGPGSILGDFRVDREIGRGGMGVVFEAEQLSLGRRVAVKVLAADGPLADTARVRFVREARAAAGLHHTHIVPVLEAGEQDGTLYYAMQRIHGRPLHRAQAELREQAPDERAYWQRAARIGRQVAEALQHAHERGILHRDIKPSNLLVDAQGDAWVTDFGLARLEDSDLTECGEILGTLRYVAPESFDGRVDARSDIYALGVTLYELLAFRSPFATKDRSELVRQISEGETVPLANAAPRVPRDLATIVGKAMHRDPRDRYATAWELAEDLARFLREEPILARRHTSTERLVRWVRRNPALAALAGSVATLLLLLVIGTTLAAAYYRRAESRQEQLAGERELQRRAAVAAAAAARTAERQVQRSLADLYRDQGLRQLADGDHLRAMFSTLRALEEVGEALEEAPATRGLTVEESLRFRLAALLDRVPPVIARRRIEEHPWQRTEFDPFVIAQLEGHPQLRFLPSGELAVVSVLGDVAFRWDPASDTLRRMDLGLTGVLPSPASDASAGSDPPPAVRFTRDAGHAVTLSAARGLELWSCEPARRICQLESVPEDAGALLGGWFSPDGKWILVSFAQGPQAGIFSVWDAVTGGRLHHHPLEIAATAPPFRLDAQFSSGSRRVCIGGSTTRVFDVAAGEPSRMPPLNVFPRPVLIVQGQRLVVAVGNSLQVFDLDAAADSSPQADIPLPTTVHPVSLACDEDGRWAVVGAIDGTLSLVDLPQGSLATAPLRHGTAPVEVLEIRPGGDAVAAADRHGLVRVWSLPSGLPLTPPLPHEEAVLSLAWREDGLQLASSTVSGDLTVWDLSKFFEEPSPDGAVDTLQLSPDGRKLLTLGRTTGLSVWDLESVPPRVVSTLDRTQARAGWYPDSARIAFNAPAEEVRPGGAEDWRQYFAWDLRSQCAARLNTDRPYRLNPVTQLLGGMDGGRCLAICTWGGPAVVDVERGTEVFHFNFREPPTIERLCCTVSDRFLACCTRLAEQGPENVLRVWSPDGRLAFQTVLPAGLEVGRLEFSPDGSRLVAIGDFGLRLWQTGSWQAVPSDWPYAEFEMIHLCFDRASTHLAVVDGNSVCHVLRVDGDAECLSSFQLPSSMRSVRFSPDGKRLAVLAVGHGLVLWDWSRGEALTPAYRCASSLLQAEFARDGSALALLHHRAGLEWLPIPAAATGPVSALEASLRRISGYERSAANDLHRLSPEAWARTAAAASSVESDRRASSKRLLSEDR